MKDSLKIQKLNEESFFSDLYSPGGVNARPDKREFSFDSFIREWERNVIQDLNDIHT